jgi:uncharacterized membrane protein YkgB
MEKDQKIRLSLLMLRIGVFIVMFIWTIDKFVRPEHAAAVFKHFYFIGGLSHTMSFIIGALEMLIILAFLFGYKKRFTYGFVLIIHGISTLSSFKQYLTPFTDPNLLFFAAWPMLAACIALYLLRDQDTLLSIEN